MFSLKKWSHRLLLLLKLKTDSGSGFSQIFDSGSLSEWKTQNPAGVESGYPDPVPPLIRNESNTANCMPCRDERTLQFFSSSPVLIRRDWIRSSLDPQIFENHQSDPVLIRQCKIIHFSFASWGKRTTGAILPLAKYDWLKTK